MGSSWRSLGGSWWVSWWAVLLIGLAFCLMAVPSFSERNISDASWQKLQLGLAEIESGLNGIDSSTNALQSYFDNEKAILNEEKQMSDERERLLTERELDLSSREVVLTALRTEVTGLKSDLERAHANILVVLAEAGIVGFVIGAVVMALVGGI